MIVSVEVQFSFPPTYPDVPPEMEVVSSTGLEPKHVDEIVTFLQEQVQCNSISSCYSCSIIVFLSTQTHTHTHTHTHTLIVLRASPFTREEDSGIILCELFPRSQECGPIRSLHVTYDLMGLSQACLLTNQDARSPHSLICGAIPSVHTSQSGARSS